MAAPYPARAANTFSTALRSLPAIPRSHPSCPASALAGLDRRPTRGPDGGDCRLRPGFPEKPGLPGHRGTETLMETHPILSPIDLAFLEFGEDVFSPIPADPQEGVAALAGAMAFGRQHAITWN